MGRESNCGYQPLPTVISVGSFISLSVINKVRLKVLLPLSSDKARLTLDCTASRIYDPKTLTTTICQCLSCDLKYVIKKGFLKEPAVIGS